MAEGADQEDKTEAPSSRRIERARADGQVALSQEVAALAVLGGAALVALLAAPSAASSLTVQLAVMLEQAHMLQPLPTLRHALLLALQAAAPFALAALVCGSVATLLQTGFLLSPKAAAPDFGRLDPRKGLARLFGSAALFEAGKSLVKVVVVGFAAWLALADALPALFSASGWPPGQLLERTMNLVLHLLAAMLVAQAIIAVLDVVVVRLRHTRSLRMTRQELLDETKESEGDPHVKGRIKRLRMQRARRRMLAAVPKATVVVTNPTHYAVALSYARDSQAAPRIVAKGVDSMAARIRAIAEQNRVPVVANPPLARALYPLPLDREIPAEFFKPVAEIIAYVWRLGRRGA